MHPSLPEKCDLRISKNYRGTTLIAQEAKVFNSLFINRIRLEMKKIPRKNQNGFRRNHSVKSQILTLRQIIEEVRTKNLEATMQFGDFFKEIQFAYGLPHKKIIVTAIMMLYKNTKAMVCFTDGDTYFFNIIFT